MSWEVGSARTREVLKLCDNFQGDLSLIYHSLGSFLPLSVSQSPENLILTHSALFHYFAREMGPQSYLVCHFLVILFYINF